MLIVRERKVGLLLLCYEVVAVCRNCAIKLIDKKDDKIKLFLGMRYTKPTILPSVQHTTIHA